MERSGSDPAELLNVGPAGPLPNTMHSLEPVTQRAPTPTGLRSVRLSRTQTQVEHDHRTAQANAWAHYQPRPATRPAPRSSTAALVVLWLVCGPLLAAGAVIAMIIPELAPVFVVAAVTVGIGVSAVQLTKHLDQRPPKATSTDVQVSFVIRRQVRPEAGAVATHQAESANPSPHPYSQHTLGTQWPAAALGNTRATLRRASDQDRSNQ